jgi:hypothetical protein
MNTTIELLKTLKAQVMSLMDKKTEDLKKWERTGSMTMVHREAHYQALMAVKDHVLQYVMKLVSGMKIEDIKEEHIGTKKLVIRKLMNDMYSGKIEEGTNCIHQFDRITIPQLAGQLQSLLEIYDDREVQEGSNDKESLIANLSIIAEQAKGGIASQLVDVLRGISIEQKQPEENKEERAEMMDIIREANEIAEAARMRQLSTDPRVGVQLLKERVEQMLLRVESLVSKLAPTSQETDKTFDTLSEMQNKHDLLVDKVQIELNVLNDRIEDLSSKIADKTGGKTITIKID